MHHHSEEGKKKVWELKVREQHIVFLHSVISFLENIKEPTDKSLEGLGEFCKVEETINKTKSQKKNGQRI